MNKNSGFKLAICIAYALIGAAGGATSGHTPIFAATLWGAIFMLAIAVFSFEVTERIHFMLSKNRK